MDLGASPKPDPTSAAASASGAASAAVPAHPGSLIATTGPQPLPSSAASLVQAATDDETLHATALGNSAHLRLQTASGEDLSLHLTVRDGVADIRVDRGPDSASGAPRIELRASEVRTALAGEGLSLGTFESSPPASPVAMRDAPTAKPAPQESTVARGLGAAAGSAELRSSLPGLAGTNPRPGSSTGSDPAGGASGTQNQNANASSNNTNTSTSPSPNTNTSANTSSSYGPGGGNGHGSGAHSHFSSGGEHDNGRAPRQPSQPLSSPTSAASSQPSTAASNVPGVSRRVHVTA